MNIHTLIERCHLMDERIITFTGSGGKTTLMYQLSNAFSELGRRSITTTTTHIRVPGPDESPRWMLLKDRYEECRDAWEREDEPPQGLTLGWELDETGAKLTGVPLELIPRLCSWKSMDILLVEADGSRGRSLKGYKPHEPVLPREGHSTLVILGMDILNKPLDHVHVHRPEIVRELLGVAGAPAIHARHLERILFHPEGYLAKAGPGRKILVLNRIENQEQHRAALELSHRLPPHGIPVIFRGPLWGYEKEHCYALGPTPTT